MLELFPDDVHFQDIFALIIAFIKGHLPFLVVSLNRCF